MTVIDYVQPLAHSFIFVCLISIIKEPYRQQAMALMLAYAGGVYLNNDYQLYPGFFGIIIGIFALLGIKYYQFIGIGWIIHGIYDWIHYTNGYPMINGAPGSAFGCAIFDFGIAIYFLLNAPDLFFKIKSKFFQTKKS